MKRVALIVMIIGVAVSSSFGQDKQTDVKTLLQLMQTEKLINETFSTLLPMFEQQAGSVIRGDSATEKSNAFLEYVKSEIKTYTRKMVDEDMVQVYDKHFTEKEIKDLIKFYKSSTGQKLLEKSPEITKDLSNIMMNKYLQDFRFKMIEKMKTIK